MSDLDQSYTQDRSLLWDLSYRITGVAADADEIVQETYVRALTRPPADPNLAWRPWLVRVAVNLSRDRLRSRRRRSYLGPWLPSPVPDDDPEHRLGARQAARYAWLVAAEQLSPQQRAVLVLRDVLGASVAETAQWLGTTESSVKVAHHRARARLRPEDAPTRPGADPGLALQQLLYAVATGDLEAALRLLAPDAVARSDGGREFQAAKVPVHGPKKIVQFLSWLSSRGGADVALAPIAINGQLGLEIRRPPQRRTDAPRSVILVDLDADGRICKIYWILSTDRLTALPVAQAST